MFQAVGRIVLVGSFYRDLPCHSIRGSGLFNFYYPISFIIDKELTVGVVVDIQLLNRIIDDVPIETAVGERSIRAYRYSHIGWLP
jgi:hypothetical protein